METSFPSTLLMYRSTTNKNLLTNRIKPNHINPNPSLVSGRTRRSKLLILPSKGKIPSAIEAEVLATTTIDPAQVEVTWQIVVGALAGVTPFIVAGIEFSKRIAEQRRCEVCSGSGLVLKDKYYLRCPGCGGFLPWQSWKKFFQVK
ncbi:Transmembrane protein [Thalictrum thalictroides]|uniref:Transmembrane protein n=1 Tax=Thalictrum thalictroides TaxID=46969 RepID=A0A7J6VGM2_THATH|nr:Transmembrane protein [Thalictrum thalictroides]